MYLFVLALIVILCLFGELTKDRFFGIPILLVLIVLAGFRLDVGRDYSYYMYLFEYQNSGRALPVKEPGYLLFISLVKEVGGTQQLVFFIVSALTVLFNFIFIKTQSKYFYLSLLTYICIGTLYMASFNQIRQYLAIGVFLYSLKYIQSRSFIKYFAVLLITAYFAHFTIILLLPFYFLLHRPFSTKQRLVLLTAVALSLPVLEMVILNSPYRYFLLARLEVPYDKTLIYVQMGISFMIIFAERFIKNDAYRIFYNMNYFSLLISLPIILSPYLPWEVFQRMNNYFTPYIVILFPYLLFRFKPSFVSVFSGSAYVLLLLLYFVRTTIFLGEFYDISPYQANFILFNF
ncbi:MAG: EpsG family protein [Cyclobacteriaceae bacterium]